MCEAAKIIIPCYSDKVRPGPLAKLTVSLAKGQWEISLKLFHNGVIKLIKQQISPENPKNGGFKGKIIYKWENPHQTSLSPSPFLFGSLGLGDESQADFGRQICVSTSTMGYHRDLRPPPMFVGF